MSSDSFGVQKDTGRKPGLQINSTWLMTGLAARPKKEDAAEGEAAASSTTRS
jgi:hypothetical protein